MHYPVMLGEALAALRVRADGLYLDATAGLGGYTRAIAAKLEIGRVVAADRDGESLEMAKQNAAGFEQRIRWVRTAFSELGAALAELGLGPLDGVVADLGVSRYQLTEAERGFSLQADGPLDMRMDRGQTTTAAALINTMTERSLADLIFQLGEERRARQIARAIVRARPLETTGQLCRVVESVARRTGRLHPATQTFQALRLAVNEELEELDALLRDAPGWLKPGGRMVVVTFHSLEDRKVKEAFRELGRTGRAVVLTKHVVKPADEEIRDNPASRSAKLRALEMR